MSASPPSSSQSKRHRGSPPAASPTGRLTGTAVDTPTKANKGLRHFSMRVCKKVEEKGTTSYNEVADELVAEFIEQRRAEIIAAGGNPDEMAPPKKKSGKGKGKSQSKDKGYDEKNIRRRVYDALNVLMAMDIISKEKKQITWKGLPSNAHHDLELLQRERRARLEEIRRKQECLQELLVQNVCFSNLVKRNKERKRAEEEEKRKARTVASGSASSTSRPNTSQEDAKGSDDVDAQDSKQAGRDPPPKVGESSSASQTGGWGTPSGDKSGSGGNNFPVPLPFIVVNTSSQAVIKCDMNPDRTDVMFDFSLPFEINDDNEILKRLQLDKTTVEDASKLFPRDLFTYAQEHGLLNDVIVDRMPDYRSMPFDRPGSPSEAYDMPSSSSAGDGALPGDSNGAQATRSAYSPPRNVHGSYTAPPPQRQIAVSGDGAPDGSS